MEDENNKTPIRTNLIHPNINQSNTIIKIESNNDTLMPLDVHNVSENTRKSSLISQHLQMKSEYLHKHELDEDIFASPILGSTTALLPSSSSLSSSSSSSSLSLSSSLPYPIKSSFSNDPPCIDLTKTETIILDVVPNPPSHFTPWMKQEYQTESLINLNNKEHHQDKSKTILPFTSSYFDTLKYNSDLSSSIVYELDDNSEDYHSQLDLALEEIDNMLSQREMREQTRDEEDENEEGISSDENESESEIEIEAMESIDTNLVSDIDIDKDSDLSISTDIDVDIDSVDTDTDTDMDMNMDMNMDINMSIYTNLDEYMIRIDDGDNEDKQHINSITNDHDDGMITKRQTDTNSNNIKPTTSTISSSSAAPSSSTAQFRWFRYFTTDFSFKSLTLDHIEPIFVPFQELYQNYHSVVGMTSLCMSMIPQIQDTNPYFQNNLHQKITKSQVKQYKNGIFTSIYQNQDEFNLFNNKMTQSKSKEGQGGDKEWWSFNRVSGDVARYHIELSKLTQQVKTIEKKYGILDTYDIPNTTSTSLKSQKDDLIPTFETLINKISNELDHHSSQNAVSNMQLYTSIANTSLRTTIHRLFEYYDETVSTATKDMINMSLSRKGTLNTTTATELPLPCSGIMPDIELKNNEFLSLLQGTCERSLIPSSFLPIYLYISGYKDAMSHYFYICGEYITVNISNSIRICQYLISTLDILANNQTINSIESMKNIKIALNVIYPLSKVILMNIEKSINFLIHIHQQQQQQSKTTWQRRIFNHIIELNRKDSNTDISTDMNTDIDIGLSLGVNVNTDLDFVVNDNDIEDLYATFQSYSALLLSKVNVAYTTTNIASISTPTPTSTSTLSTTSTSTSQPIYSTLLSSSHPSSYFRSLHSLFLEQFKMYWDHISTQLFTSYIHILSLYIHILQDPSCETKRVLRPTQKRIQSEIVSPMTSEIFDILCISIGFSREVDGSGDCVGIRESEDSVDSVDSLGKVKDDQQIHHQHSHHRIQTNMSQVTNINECNKNKNNHTCGIYYILYQQDIDIMHIQQCIYFIHNILSNITSQFDTQEKLSNVEVVKLTHDTMDLMHTNDIKHVNNNTVNVLNVKNVENIENMKRKASTIAENAYSQDYNRGNNTTATLQQKKIENMKTISNNTSSNTTMLLQSLRRDRGLPSSSIATRTDYFNNETENRQPLQTSTSVSASAPTSRTLQTADVHNKYNSVDGPKKRPTSSLQNPQITTLFSNKKPKQRKAGVTTMTLLNPQKLARARAKIERAENAAKAREDRIKKAIAKKEEKEKKQAAKKAEIARKAAERAAKSKRAVITTAINVHTNTNTNTNTNTTQATYTTGMDGVTGPGAGAGAGANERRDENRGRSRIGNGRKTKHRTNRTTPSQRLSNEDLLGLIELRLETSRRLYSIQQLQQQQQQQQLQRQSTTTIPQPVISLSAKQAILSRNTLSKRRQMIDHVNSRLLSKNINDNAIEQRVNHTFDLNTNEYNTDKQKHVNPNRNANVDDSTVTVDDISNVSDISNILAQSPHNLRRIREDEALQVEAQSQSLSTQDIIQRVRHRKYLRDQSLLQSTGSTSTSVHVIKGRGSTVSGTYQYPKQGQRRSRVITLDQLTQMDIERTTLRNKITAQMPLQSTNYGSANLDRLSVIEGGELGDDNTRDKRSGLTSGYSLSSDRPGRRLNSNGNDDNRGNSRRYETRTRSMTSTTSTSSIISLHQSATHAHQMTLSSLYELDVSRLGPECVRLTNIFRKEHNLEPVQWHHHLAMIGYQHSVDMGNGVVPFDHVGFNERVEQYPFHAVNAAENLAWIEGEHISRIAKQVVDGWINSPGHRKNLLSRANWCGIAIFITPGERYYFTQLFGQS